MATLRDLWDTIRNSLVAATGLPRPQVFLDVAADGTVSNIAQGIQQKQYDVAISIFDGQWSRDKTRWPSFVAAQPKVVPTNATIGQSAVVIPPGGDLICYIGQQPEGFVANDAVGITVWNGNNSLGKSATVILPGETPATLAAKLADGINADENLGTWISALATNEYIIIKNLLASSLTLKAAAGNIATQPVVVANQERCILISLWTRTEPQREQYGQIILQTLAQQMQNFGLQLPDGSWARVKMNRDMPTKDTHLPDIYRWLFYIDVEASVILDDTLWSVLAIDGSESVGVVS